MRMRPPLTDGSPGASLLISSPNFPGSQSKRTRRWRGFGPALMLLALLAAPALRANDNETPLFGDPLEINGNYFYWEFAEDDGTYRTDYYSDGLTVASKIGNPNLATVSGGFEYLDGHWNNGSYHHNYEEESDGYSYSIVTQYTVNLDAGQVAWRYSETTWNEYDWYTDWTNSAGQSGWEAGGSYSGPGEGEEITLWGMTFSHDQAESWWYSDSLGVSASESDNYYSSAESSSLVLTVASSGSSTSTTLTGSDPYIGSFSATASGSVDPSNLESAAWSWAPRTAPSFSAAQLWANGALLAWQGGALQTNGTVTDTYASAGGGQSLTLSAALRYFAQEWASAVVKWQGTTIGSLNQAGAFSISAPNSVVPSPANTSNSPFFLPNSPSLWVNGSEYAFAGGCASGGSRIDVYANPSLGMVRLLGTTAGTASVNGNLETSFFAGTLSAGVFAVSGMSIGSAPPPALGPPALWVRGRIYVRDESDAHAYEDAAEGSSGSFTLAETGPTGVWIAGEDSSGAFAGPLPAEAGVFLIQDDADAWVVPAVTAESAVLLHAPVAGPPEPLNLPHAIRWQNAVFTYLGTAAEDTASGHDAAYYGVISVPSPGHCTELVKIRLELDGQGLAVVTHTRYLASGGTPLGSTTGWYDPATHLFHKNSPYSPDPQSGFPKPFNAVLPGANHIFWREQAPSGSGLPPSFIVRGEAWWFAGMEGGNALYHGYDLGQVITIAPPDPEAGGNRLVTLQEWVQNPNDPGAPPIQTTTQGTLSAQRGSVRLRDGTLAFRGDESGAQDMVAHQDDYRLHTIAADLDLLGNHFSFGLLNGDASLAGVLFQFSDDSNAATLHNALSRPLAQWRWWKSGTTPGAPLQPVMRLDTEHQLRIHSPTAATQETPQPGILLNPEAGGASSLPGTLRVRPGGDLSMGQYTTGGQP